MPSRFTRRDDLRRLSNTVDYYSKFFSACQVIDDPETDEGKAVNLSHSRGIRQDKDWPSNQSQRKEVERALRAKVKLEATDSAKEVTALLRERKFVVLQGAPGTGKTRTAKIVAKSLAGKVFFTQFHAETSYSDFVHGIVPDTSENELLYRKQAGILDDAIQFSIKNPYPSTVLIVDEINRANLSNVLGPVFYLFEYKMEESDVEIEISPGLSVKKLPENFFVIATMNTADRISRL